MWGRLRCLWVRFVALIVLDKNICKITAHKMKVPAKVIIKMIKENEHNKYTTT